MESPGGCEVLLSKLCIGSGVSSVMICCCCLVFEKGQKCISCPLEEREDRWNFFWIKIPNWWELGRHWEVEERPREAHGLFAV